MSWGHPSEVLHCNYNGKIGQKFDFIITLDSGVPLIGTGSAPSTSCPCFFLRKSELKRVLNMVQHKKENNLFWNISYWCMKETLLQILSKNLFSLHRACLPPFFFQHISYILYIIPVFCTPAPTLEYWVRLYRCNFLAH